ncbi:MAG: sugar kinase [Pseudobdellovibrionaceae bacterium]|nr:sugar kinase [Bdellovibrionales bacterium]USN47386.1 MAG: sugar kinase [Pseudobdellovibrionaceae bacterium]
MSEILVVGSVAYDSITTPSGYAEFTLGGSANYFSVAASLYSHVNVVGVVGEDYKDEDLQLLKSRDVSLEGLQQVAGKTFHWEGRYEGDMNDAITLETQLNVFEKFNPVIPDSYKKSPYVFLANIDPELQAEVLDQMEEPKLVGLDTMNFWIDSKIDSLKAILARVDVLLINEGEARKLADTHNTIQAVARLGHMGPKAVVVKRGEYGFVLYTDEKFFILPAFPVRQVIDPTGAGDTFAGGFFGYLSKMNGSWSVDDLKRACIQGVLLASYTVEDFGLGRLRQLDWAKVEKRFEEYMQVISYPHL